MAHFVIENFANGLDLRRAHDTAPPGSLRTLNNAFINEGGEIEKRKAFSLHTALTAYGQTANYKARIAGPFQVGSRGDTIVFRHRHNSLPSSGWTAGTDTDAMLLTVSTKPSIRAWAMKSLISLSADFGSCLRVNAAAVFGDFVHVIETFNSPIFTQEDNQHIEVEIGGGSFAGGDAEPIAETRITANNNYPTLMILKDKAYVAGGNTLKASAVGDPGDMAGTGSGSLDVRAQGAPIGTIMQLGEYFGQLAVFGQKGVQFWDVDADFDLNQYLRTIVNSSIGSTTNGARSATGYGDGDILFLSKSGIRSLSARDSSNLAKVTDVGSPIDKVISAALDVSVAPSETTDGTSQDTANFFHMANGIVHQGTGQFWLFLKEKVYVLSVHDGAKVRAWSTFDLPTVQPANVSTRNGTLKSRWCADACTINDDLCFRNFADEVFFYGGTNSKTYDTSTVEVITPHMDLGKPGIEKTLAGFDIACTGTWVLEVSVNPNTIVWETAGTFVNSSFSPSGRIPFEARFTHIALRLTNTVAEAAKVGQITIYYTSGDER